MNRKEERRIVNLINNFIELDKKLESVSDQLNKLESEKNSILINLEENKKKEAELISMLTKKYGKNSVSPNKILSIYERSKEEH